MIIGGSQYATKISVKALEAKLVRHTKVVEKFYCEYKTKRILDMLAFADQAERTDFATNKLREDCVVVSGMFVCFELSHRVIPHSSVNCVPGLRGKDFPQEIAEQNVRASEIMKVIVLKVLSREEPFSLTVKKVFERKYARGTGEVLIPPIEVIQRSQVGLTRQ